MKAKVNKELARKVLEIVDAGLVSGLGEAKPGHMCVEAAVCYALGEPHTDRPSCVGSAVRAFKIRLNDGPWSSNEARTQGMRELAIAQLGSDEIDQKAFAREVAFQVIKQILPIALRAAASKVPAQEQALLVCAVVCESVKDLTQARKAAQEAKTAAYAADADADAYAAAAYAAYAAAYAAYAAADAAAADAKKQKRDEALKLAAKIGLGALKKLKSQGCKWLSLAA